MTTAQANVVAASESHTPVTIVSLDTLGEDNASHDRTGCLEDRRFMSRPFDRARVHLDYGAFLRSPRVTVRETFVFHLLANGHTTSQIAHRLGIRASSVCQVKSSLARKLEAFFGESINPNHRGRMESPAGRKRALEPKGVAQPVGTERVTYQTACRARAVAPARPAEGA